MKKMIRKLYVGKIKRYGLVRTGKKKYYDTNTWIFTKCKCYTYIDGIKIEKI